MKNIAIFLFILVGLNCRAQEDKLQLYGGIGFTTAGTVLIAKTHFAKHPMGKFEKNGLLAFGIAGAIIGEFMILNHVSKKSETQLFINPQGIAIRIGIN